MDFYHLLNRGVDKRKIFLAEKDYLRFVHNLFVFNDQKSTDPNSSYHFNHGQYMDIGCPYIGKWERKRARRSLLVHIHAFCLMPNHYHLLVSPLADDGISRFMKKINMGYAKYFNEKHDRSGALFQGKYKSIQVTEERHFMFLPFYIHFNPLDLKMPTWREGYIKSPRNALDYLASYRWSSHADYLNKNNFPSVTERKFFTDYFEEIGGYTKLAAKHIRDFDIASVEQIALE